MDFNSNLKENLGFSEVEKILSMLFGEEWETMNSYDRFREGLLVVFYLNQRDMRHTLTLRQFLECMRDVHVLVGREEVEINIGNTEEYETEEILLEEYLNDQIQSLGMTPVDTHSEDEIFDEENVQLYLKSLKGQANKPHKPTKKKGSQKDSRKRATKIDEKISHHSRETYESVHFEDYPNIFYTHLEDVGLQEIIIDDSNHDIEDEYAQLISQANIEDYDESSKVDEQITYHSKQEYELLTSNARETYESVNFEDYPNIFYTHLEDVGLQEIIIDDSKHDIEDEYAQLISQANIEDYDESFKGKCYFTTGEVKDVQKQSHPKRKMMCDADAAKAYWNTPIYKRKCEKVEVILDEKLIPYDFDKYIKEHPSPPKYKRKYEEVEEIQDEILDDTVDNKFKECFKVMLKIDDVFVVIFYILTLQIL
ncbi:hypothetical protein GWI33_012880 [Rhynchophorus ferrugineus]|uniref:Uncharacterized protein n=1 Tax=Rhynchophorus ferrugineus TaxID=354439 RepID=A0A834I7K6_RHYFE|nr:hypothetical protein GWI33_012880 [Rhynchophorus ferrugineus]